MNKDLNKYFSKEYLQISRHIKKKCSTSLNTNTNQNNNTPFHTDWGDIRNLCVPFKE